MRDPINSEEMDYTCVVGSDIRLVDIVVGKVKSLLARCQSGDKDFDKFNLISLSF